MRKQNKNETQILLNSENCSSIPILEVKKIKIYIYIYYLYMVNHSVNFTGCKVNNTHTLCTLSCFFF